MTTTRQLYFRTFFGASGLPAISIGIGVMVEILQATFTARLGWQPTFILALFGFASIYRFSAPSKIFLANIFFQTKQSEIKILTELPSFKNYYSPFL